MDGRGSLSSIFFVPFDEANQDQDWQMICEASEQQREAEIPRKRCTTEQIINKLRQAEDLISQVRSIRDVAKELAISDRTDVVCCASFGLTLFSGTGTDVDPGGTAFPVCEPGVDHVAFDGLEDCEQGDMCCADGNIWRCHSSDKCADIMVCNDWVLHRPNFIDPYACDVWIVLCDFFCRVEVFGFDDIVAGDGLHAHRQICGSAL